MGLESLVARYHRALCAEYRRKGDRICAGLGRVGLARYVPVGVYYLLANASRLPGGTGKEKAMHLLARVGVASVPGEASLRRGPR